MSRLVVTVPIQLTRDDDGFWLQVTTPTKREASVRLDQLGGPLTSSIFDEWANHVFKEASLKARRSTGVKDINGNAVWEGDLIRVRHSDPYPSAVGVVTWEPAVAAFVLKGDTERHGPWTTDNLRGVGKGWLIGNIFEQPKLLTPAEYRKMPDED